MSSVAVAVDAHARAGASERRAALRPQVRAGSADVVCAAGGRHRLALIELVSALAGVGRVDRAADVATEMQAETAAGAFSRTAEAEPGTVPVPFDPSVPTTVLMLPEALTTRTTWLPVSAM